MRLQKFYEYINEAAEWDIEAVEEMLLPIKDLGFGIQVSEPAVVADPSSRLYKKMVRNITIWVKNQWENSLNADVDIFTFKENATFERQYCSDPRMFELLIEFGNLCSRLSNDGAAMSLSWQESAIRLNLLQVVDDSTTPDEEIELKQLFSELRTRWIKSTSDFAREMIFEPKEVDQVKDSITLRCGGWIGAFTKRKWSAFTKGIDMSKFNVSIRHDKEDRDVVYLTITSK